MSRYFNDVEDALEQAHKRLRDIQHLLSYENYREALKWAIYLQTHLVNAQRALVGRYGSGPLGEIITECQELTGLIVSKDKRLGEFMERFKEHIAKKITDSIPHLHILTEIKCPYCRENNPRDSNFCGHCGKKLPQ